MSNDDIIDRTSYPHGVPCMIDTEQPDPRAAAEFYGGVFGWTFENMLPPHLDDQYLIASLDGYTVAAIASPTPGVTTDATWNTYVSVVDADVTVKRATEHGAETLVAPVDVGPPGSTAGRWAALADPEGAQIRVWQPGSRHGAQLVNSPGSWNSSDLNTVDPTGAAEFYGAVFGWQADPVSFGGGEVDGDSYMWRLPGYGDFLAIRDPGIERRHSEPWVPAGFSDAIGWMAAATTQPAAPPRDAWTAHWSITFGVSDTDATVDRALAHGATVVTAPRSLGGGVVRQATLQDPQGARFTIGSFDPTAIAGS